MSNDTRNTLWRDIESELEKTGGSIDPDYIDRRIDELCELEARHSGLRPPETTEAQINAVITRIIARARRKRPALRLTRLAAAACFLLIFSFFVFFAINYSHTGKTNPCFPMGITLSCGTDYCPCEKKQPGENI